jgi:small Trp-rich protein
MWFVAVGVLLLVLKLAGVAVVGQWPWWVVLAPFGLAAAWWAFADSAGITQRQAMEQERARSRKRREQQYENLGMRVPREGGTSARGKPAARDDQPR